MSGDGEQTPASLNRLAFSQNRFFISAVILAAAVCLVFLFSLEKNDFIIYKKDTSGQRVALRCFPYPYRAMAALVNDCDNTTLRSFERYHRFLNTRSETVYGTGLGLDVSDSFFAYTAAEDYNSVMTYFSGADAETLKDARFIERYIRCGWIDALHAYGDFSSPVGGAPSAAATMFTRNLAAGAYELLSRDHIIPAVWTDHGNNGNVQNFGSYGPEASARYKRGDDPASKDYYHTDITLSDGVKYVWDAKQSGRFGYDFPLQVKTLRDGRKVWAFSRYTGGSGGDGYKVSAVGAASAGANAAASAVNAVASGNAEAGSGVWDWYPDRLRYAITEARLTELTEKGQFGLFAQHLGYYGEDYLFEPEDLAALKLLEKYQYEQELVLIAGTARLFEYATAKTFVRYTAKRNNPGDSWAEIDIVAIDDPLFPETKPSLERVRGLTFYCDDPDYVDILLSGTPVAKSEIMRNPADETGRPSVSIRWHTPDTADYTRFG